ncbi:MAG: glycosyltransferase [Thermoplasmatota archaeon]
MHTEGRLLHIAIVSDTHLPTTNGVVRSIETSRHALEALGARVTVFAPRTSAKRVFDAPHVRRYAAIETRFYPDLRVSVLPLLPRHLAGHDVVHVHTPGPLGLAGILAARRAGIPAIYTYHTRFDESIPHFAPTPWAERLVTRAVSRVERFIAREVRELLAPTPALAAEIETRLGKPCRAMPSGVDTALFRPLVRAEHAGPRFLHLGRLAPEKNVGAVLTAFRTVLAGRPDARLAIGGSGPDAARLARRARELGIAHAIDWLGFVPEPDLPRVYGEADVYVTASRFETQGLTTLEALACGTPAVLANVPVFFPMEQAGAAFLADPADPREFGGAMLAALSGRPQRARNALAFARAHSVEICARRLLAVSERVAAPRPALTPA